MGLLLILDLTLSNILNIKAVTDLQNISLLDWLLIVFVLFAVEDFYATFLGSWTTGETAEQKNYLKHVRSVKHGLLLLFVCL